MGVWVTVGSLLDFSARCTCETMPCDVSLERGLLGLSSVHRHFSVTYMYHLYKHKPILRLERPWSKHFLPTVDIYCNDSFCNDKEGYVVHVVLVGCSTLHF